MDHEIPFKNPEEFFNNKMFIDLNNELHLNKEDNMFDQEILDNYATQILDTKYKKVDTNKVAANQKNSMLTNATSYNTSWSRTKNYLMGLLLCIPTKKFTFTYYQAQNSKPVHYCMYLVPQVHKCTFKK